LSEASIREDDQLATVGQRHVSAADRIPPGQRSLESDGFVEVEIVWRGLDRIRRRGRRLPPRPPTRRGEELVGRARRGRCPQAGEQRESLSPYGPGACRIGEDRRGCRDVLGRTDAGERPEDLYIRVQGVGKAKRSPGGALEAPAEGRRRR